MPYPGGKSLNGIYQGIINQIPPHRVYVELFLGGGAILRLKRPAESSIGIEIDPEVIGQWRNSESPGFQLFECDAIEWLKHRFDLYRRLPNPHANHLEHVVPAVSAGEQFIYADPPYMKATRSSPRRIYRYDMDDDRHIEFLKTVKSVPCQIMISGYWSELYADELATWRLVRLPSSTRSNRQAVECLWMNYAPPSALHDYSHVGNNKRERERIRRRVKNWKQGISRLPDIERKALVNGLLETYLSPTTAHFEENKTWKR